MTSTLQNAEDTCLKNHSVTDRADAQPRGTIVGSCAALDSPNDSSYESCLEKAPVDSDATLVSERHDVPTTDIEKQAMPVPDRPALTRTATVLTYPEGGLQAWLVVLGSFCAMFSIYGLINTAAVFESYFATHQLASYSSSQIGWVFSLNLFLVFFIGIQVGPIFDRFGPRILVAAGSVLIVASLEILSVCQEYYQIILAYSVLGGLGGALLNAPAYGAIAHFFNIRRGFATGLATTSGGIGGIVFPILLQYLLPKVGFAWSSRILGFILLGLAVPTNLFIKSRLPPRRNADGTIKMGSVWPDLTLYLDPRFSLCAAGIFLMEIGLFVPLTFIVSYAADHGQTATDSYVILSLLNAGSVLGRFLPGLAADRLGRFNIIMVTILLCTATTIGLWLPAGNSRSVLIVYAVLFGFASGSNLGLVPVCLGQLCDARDYARYYTAAMLVASFGSLLGSPLGGALLGLGGETGWLALILFSGLAYAGAFGCFSAARVLAVGWGLKKVF